MNQTYNIPTSALFLRQGPFTRPATPGPAARFADPRATHPVVADGFIRLVKLLWKQWSTKRADVDALTPAAHGEATQRRIHRLPREVSAKLERGANPASTR